MSIAELQKSLSPEINGMSKCGAKLGILGSGPKPIFIIEWKKRWADLSTPLMFLQVGLGRLRSSSKSLGLVRCVGIENLPKILEHGCDVFPTDSVLWVDKFPDKPLEYGGDEKVMMVFDFESTEATYVEVDSNIDKQRFDELESIYPTVVRSDDGSKIWFSRLAEDDRRITSPYEVEHGRWIPGDPFEALSGLVVLCRNLDETTIVVKSAVEKCEHRRRT